MSILKEAWWIMKGIIIGGLQMLFKKKKSKMYDIPSIILSDINNLQIRPYRNLGFAIWNKEASDWVRDSNGYVDGRIVLSNAEKLLNGIKAKAIFIDATVSGQSSTS